jgi:hypothetical protein
VNYYNLQKAISEAKRFIEIAELVPVISQNYSDDCVDKKLRGKPFYTLGTGKRSGACRRASLDLTRSLADLRRG